MATTSQIPVDNFDSDSQDNSEPDGEKESLHLASVEELPLTPARETWKPSPKQVARAHAAGINPLELTDRLKREDATAPPSMNRPWTYEDFSRAFDDAIESVRSRARWEKMMQRYKQDSSGGHKQTLEGAG